MTEAIKDASSTTSLAAEVVDDAKSAQVRGTSEQTNSTANQQDNPIRGQLTVDWTCFGHYQAKVGTLRTNTVHEFYDLIKNAPLFADKKAQPLLKLGTYENNSRAKDSALSKISGVELDYDAEQVTIEEAAGLFRAAGIEALLYSSFSSKPAAPRWRVLLVLSKPTHADHRAAWVAAANSVLGNIAGSESYTPKQIFFWGRPDDDYQVIHCQGEYLDLLPAMQEAADNYVISNTPAKESPKPHNPHYEQRSFTEKAHHEQVDDARLALFYVDQDMDRKPWLNVIAACWDYGEAAGKQLATEFAERSGKNKPKAFEKEWLSVRDWGVTRATIFYHARQNRAYIDKLATQRDPHNNSSSGTGASKKAQERRSASDNTPAAPQPLPPDLPPVDSFYYDLLPDELGAWVQDVALRMSAPPDFVAVGLLVELGAVLGRKLSIRPMALSDWAVVANLWGLLIGRPSMKKSPSLSAAGQFRERLEAAATRIFEEEMEQYTSQAKVIELMEKELEAATKKAIKEQLKSGGVDVSALAGGLKVDAQEEPVRKRYSTNDVTPASLVELLRKAPNGILAIRDELAGLLKECDAENGAGKRELLLQAWNGYGQYIIDRIGRGMALKVDGLCLSLIGGSQPTKIASYIKSAINGGVGDDGLMQRFNLTVWPDVGEFKEHDAEPDKALSAAVHRIFKRLDELTPEQAQAMQDVDDQGEPDGLPYLRFDHEAQQLFREWRTDLNVRARGDDIHPAMESHLIKYEKLVPALALIFHMVEVGRGAVGATALYRALAWAEYLETHANRLYASVTMGKVTGAKAILTKIKTGKLSNPFRARDVYNSGWAGLDKTSTTEGLNLLVDYGWLSEHEPNNHKGGRPTVEFYLNPLAEGLL